MLYLRSFGTYWHWSGHEIDTSAEGESFTYYVVDTLEVVSFSLKCDYLFTRGMAGTSTPVYLGSRPAQRTELVLTASGSAHTGHYERRNYYLAMYLALGVLWAPPRIRCFRCASLSELTAPLRRRIIQNPAVTYAPTEGKSI